MPGNIKAFTVVWYDSRRNKLYLTINIREDLFVSNLLEERTERKTLSVHEFVHCLAAIIPLFKISMSQLVERLGCSAHEIVFATTASDFKDFRVALEGIGEASTPHFSDMLTDAHYRKVAEEEDAFHGHYGELCHEFLLSYELFKETFYKCRKDYPALDGRELLLKASEYLLTEKAVEKGLFWSKIEGYKAKLKEEGLL
jgi:hypothetical protein